MKVGNVVKVKKGIISPDYEDMLIENWVGRIVEIESNILKIELDSITLSELKEDYIIDSLFEGFEYNLICLLDNDVEISNPRDTQNDVFLMQKKIETKYSTEEEDKRIGEILNSDDLSVNEKNLDCYLIFLKSNLKTPCLLTGAEDFEWEEPYVFGDWSQDEYEKLKKTRPSYTDEYKLIKLEKDYDESRGIFAKVKRTSDNKTFTIPLLELEVVKKSESNYQIVSDYSSWMANNM